MPFSTSSSIGKKKLFFHIECRIAGFICNKYFHFETIKSGDKSSPSSDKRKNPFAFTRGMSTTTVTTTDPEIAAQQKKSLMADSEAQIKVSYTV